jgi:hypothetical protein
MLNRQITTAFKVKNKPTSITPDSVKSSGQAVRALPTLEGIQRLWRLWLALFSPPNCPEDFTESLY